MQLRKASSFMMAGLLAVPVTSFSLAPSSASMLNSLSSTALHVSTQAQEQARGTGMEPTEIDIDMDITVINPNANANANGNKSASKKNRKGKQRRNPAKDIHFLVKRTNQIISQEPISNNSNSNSSNSSNTSTVTIQTFHWLMDAWTASLHPTAPEHSLSLMNCMKEYNIQPTSKTLTKVLNAYGKCGRGGEAAQEIIDSCINAANSDSSSSMSIPMLDTDTNNVFVYNALLEAYAEKPVFGSEGSVRNAVKTEQLLDQMMQEKGMVPNGRSFQAVIRAWGNSNVEIGALKGEQILDRMEKMVRSGEMDATEGPTVIHYNAVLDAWANSVLDNHAQRAEVLLNKMMAEKKVQPNTISFNACIDAYAKNGDGDKAEELLNKMDEFWRKQGIQEYKPDTRSYNSVMNAFSKSLEKNAAAKAETILRKMEVKPDFFSFAIVINAWARSLEYGKAKKAQQLYLEMVDLYNKGNRSLRPNVVIFNSVLNACAYTVGDGNEQQNAMGIATSMMKELKNSRHVTADHITYGTFLKVCLNEMPQSEVRCQLVATVFRKAAKDGQVGQFVFDQMGAVATPTQYEELVGNYSSWKDLPEEWTCNVIEGKKQRRHSHFEV